MEYYNDSTNFTIVMPTKCNARCNFCFWEGKDIDCSEEYLKNLEKELKERKPKNITISGGEPTLLFMENEHVFNRILEIVGRSSGRERVVFNTNGYKLKEVLIESYIFGRVVNHVNISRHSVDDSMNKKIFNAITLPSKKKLKTMGIIAARLGIDITLNVVYENKDNLDISEWVEFIKEIEYKALVFRQNIESGLKQSNANEEMLKTARSMYKSICIVCKSETFTIRGIDLTFKYGVEETDRYMSKDVIFELIFNERGILTVFWDPDNKDYKKIDKEVKEERGMVRSYYTKFSCSEPTKGGC